MAYGSKIDPPKVSGYATNSSPFSVGSDSMIRIPLLSSRETALKIGLPSPIDGGRGWNQGCFHPLRKFESIFSQRSVQYRSTLVSTLRRSLREGLVLVSHFWKRGD